MARATIQTDQHSLCFSFSAKPTRIVDPDTLGLVNLGSSTLELMPSWKIPAVPGYENLDPLDVLNDAHLLGKADDNQIQQNSGSNNQNININNQDKSVGLGERQFHLGLGLADPRLQQGSQHLGFGSLDADSTGSFCEQAFRGETDAEMAMVRLTSFTHDCSRL